MADESAAACFYCGQEIVEELHEVWGHDFMLDTCCEERRAHFAQALCADRAMAKAFFASAGVPEVRRVAESGPALIVDFKIEIRSIAQKTANAFVKLHHQHCPISPAGWKFGAGLYNGRSLIGVIFVGRPASRALDDGSRLEVTRLCLDLALPDALRWNACSQAYGWAAREASARGCSHISTYIRDDETGVSLKAAGWTLERHTPGGAWMRRGKLTSSQNTGPKTRWGRSLTPLRKSAPI